MGERTRGTIWCGRALLLAALLLGIFTMHTLGHPSSEPAPREPAPVAAVAAPVHGATDTAPHEAAPHEAAPHNDRAEHGADSTHGDHGMGMDPMSVCLAVLGVWTAAALLGATVVLALRSRPRDLLAPRRARVLRALWPLPPPSTSDRLARLSILRV